MTDDSAPQIDPPLAADPDRYDEYRNVAARKRGLEQAYIAGGDDPQLPETLRRERPYVRLLVIMVAVIVAMGFILGIVAGAMGIG